MENKIKFKELPTIVKIGSIAGFIQLILWALSILMIIGTAFLG